MALSLSTWQCLSNRKYGPDRVRLSLSGDRRVPRSLNYLRFLPKEVTMITNVSKEKLVEVGSRFRAMYLVEQAGYTPGIALPVRPASGAGDEPKSARTNCQKLVFSAELVLIDPP